jgi:glycine/D-amino acid oxidase-like deaminating enzyme
MFSPRKKVAIIGSGVVNLITAYFLAKQQYELVIIDKAISPLKNRNWKKQGCTFGGENVRMYTYSEADNYNEKNNQLYSKMNEAFEQTIDNNGWLTRSKETLNKEELSWIQDFHAVSPNEAVQYSEDIYTVNIKCDKLWKKWIKDAPELFDDLDLVNGILRIYSEKADFQAAQQLHNRINSLTHAFDSKTSLLDYPVFGYAHHTGMLSGCILTKGFTLKVQDLCKKIIHFLIEYGAEFKWETTFSGIQRNKWGNVEGVFLNGELKEFDHYVLSLGAYAGTSLHNTQTKNQLHGVLGVWLTIPNLYPELKHSMKIHKKGHVGEDTNITLINKNGKAVLVLGSGYGYTGNSTKNHIKNNELEGIFNSLKHTAQTYFPEAYEAASTYIDDTRKYCVRSWTPTGLGVFETIPTIGGGQLIITGGNNTGGFTQSPYIADAVLSALSGEKHPMHQLFHPNRMKSLNRSAQM